MRMHAAVLRAEKIEEAENYLAMMEDIHTLLMRFDFPSALVPIKRKQDVSRGLIEKTRGDLTTALHGQRLHNKMKALEEKLQ